MGCLLRRWLDLEVLLQGMRRTVWPSLASTDHLWSTQVKRISLSKNILRAIDANPDIPSLSAYPRSHQVSAFHLSALTKSLYRLGNIWILYWHAEFSE